MLVAQVAAEEAEIHCLDMEEAVVAVEVVLCLHHFL
jgi:hypothetical protein